MYGNNNTRLTEANDSMAFATRGNEDTKGSKKKEITCYKCKKTSHYANKCEEDDETINKKGDLNGYITVWYHPEGIANILSLQNVQKKHKVTFDSSPGTGFVVHKADVTSHVFMPSSKGLFFSDVKGNIVYVLINTVDKNKNKYKVKQYSDARKARLIQDIIGRQDYVKYLENDLIPNCLITKEDIICAGDILGPNLGSLKGETTRKTPEREVLKTLDNMPNELLEEHGDVTICK